MRSIQKLSADVFNGPLGTLNVLSNTDDFPIEIKRIFWVTDVPKNTTRGFHAHKNGHQILICINGSVSATFFDGVKEEKVLLQPGGVAVWMKNMVWGEQTFLEEGSTLLVLASNPYDETDYIRDRALFEALAKEAQ